MTAARLTTFLFDYPYNGSRHGLEIKAYSQEEAEGRFRAIQYGRYLGSNAFKVPAIGGMGWIPRLLCWWRNRA